MRLLGIMLAVKLLMENGQSGVSYGVFAGKRGDVVVLAEGDGTGEGTVEMFWAVDRPGVVEKNALETICCSSSVR